MEELTAQQLFDLKDYEGAIVAFRKIVEFQPADAFSWKFLGLSWVLTGHQELGLEACQKAAELRPDNSEIRYSLGYALGHGGDFERAIEEFDAALYLEPQNEKARQGLLYSLTEHGKRLAAGDDPRTAEPFLDRAYKLSSLSPNTIAPLLAFFLDTGQPIKAVKLASDVPKDLRNTSQIQQLYARMESDPEVAKHLKLADAGTHSGANPVKPANQPAQAQNIVYVGCPNCKQDINAMAFICPHCNFRIKEAGTFAGRDQGSVYVWQDYALTIIAILIMIGILVDMVRAFSLPSLSRNFVIMLDLVWIFFCVSCLFRWEVPMTIAKYLLYAPMIYIGFFTMYTLMSGAILVGLIMFVFLALLGLFIYLINWASD